MCLYIDNTLHAGKVKSRRATQDILVYKVLRVVKGYDAFGQATERYEAPYRGTDWQMGVKKTATMKVYDAKTYYASVEEGLHSCLTQARARTRNSGWNSTRVFPAIIPKGSNVYFGTNGEAASNALIVYKNRAELVKARGAIGPGIKRAQIAI